MGRPNFSSPYNTPVYPGALRVADEFHFELLKELGLLERLARNGRSRPHWCEPQLRGPRRRRLAYIRSQRERSAAQIIEAMNEELKAFSVDSPSSDDTTLVAMRRSRSAAKCPF